MLIFIKILKIILIIVLAIILFFFLLTLFSVNFILIFDKNKDKYRFDFKVDYLLKLIEFKISILEKLKMTLRVLFININLNKKKRVKKDNRHNNKINIKLAKANNNKDKNYIPLKLNDKKVTYKDAKKYDKRLDKELDNNETKKSNIKKKSLIKKYKELDDEDREYIKNYFASLVKNILNIIKPKDIKLDFTFGLEDPYTVGEILAVLGVLYNRFGDSIKVKPVFNKNLFDGKIYIKGSFRLINIVILAIKLLLNKKVREFIWKT